MRAKEEHSTMRTPSTPRLLALSALVALLAACADDAPRSADATVDVRSDASLPADVAGDHNGCRLPCAPGETCVAGVCRGPCSEGQAVCDGRCVNDAGRRTDR